MTTTKNAQRFCTAGTLEKLKVAVNYAQMLLSLVDKPMGCRRGCAGNFLLMSQKVSNTTHVVLMCTLPNMVTYEGNEKGVGEWFRELRDMGLDAYRI